MQRALLLDPHSVICKQKLFSKLLEKQSEYKPKVVLIRLGIYLLVNRARGAGTTNFLFIYELNLMFVSRDLWMKFEVSHKRSMGEI
jgi:hypothetical protein